MEDFIDVANARQSYTTFAEALKAGREILRRAGVPDPPPVPDFDTVFQRLDSGSRAALFKQVRSREKITPKEALQIWQPLVKRALGAKRKANEFPDG